MQVRPEDIGKYGKYGDVVTFENGLDAFGRPIPYDQEFVLVEHD